MRSPTPNKILITGATGAIGSALARYYAHTGAYLILLGRNKLKLENITKECEDLGATVDTVRLDLRETSRLQSWLVELNEKKLPDLIVANAGININIGTDNKGESWKDIDTLLEINIKANFALINTLIPAMRTRGSGQIAIISSLAAYYGLPVTPSYCASKAALKAYGEALRGWLSSEGIKVNVIMPGYVESNMCSAMPGPKPFLCSPEKAAELIAKGLQKNKPRISFPFPLNIGTWFLSVFPPSLSQFILRILNYGS